MLCLLSSSFLMYIYGFCQEDASVGVDACCATNNLSACLHYFILNRKLFQQIRDFVYDLSSTQNSKYSNCAQLL